jgi:hypothetical protein
MKALYQFIAVMALSVCLSGCTSGWPKPSVPHYHAATVSQASQRAEEWRSRGMVIRVITGVSMRPFISDGDLVALEPYTNQPLSPGMIVDYDRGDSPRTLHMIVAISPRAALIDGINNPRTDGWHALSSIHYIAREIIDYRGSSQQYLLKPILPKSIMTMGVTIRARHVR